VSEDSFDVDLVVTLSPKTMMKGNGKLLDTGIGPDSPFPQRLIQR